MLQFITNPSDRWSIAEEVRMAIEGGCRWIQLRMKDASDEDVRRTALELIPLCRDHDTFLIIDDRVELVNELRVSGVHLGRGDMDPMEARELLGPHAIIGVTANTAEDIIKWKGKDVDYVARPRTHHLDQKKSRPGARHRWGQRGCRHRAQGRSRVADRSYRRPHARRCGSA